MKNVSISLTDRHAAEIELEFASGDYASVSEVVRAALREFLGRGAPDPGPEQIDRDIARYLAEHAAGVPLIDADTAQARIRGQRKE